MYTLKIKVTKEILEKSKNCGYVKNFKWFPSYSAFENHNSNCAFACAVNEIFPKTNVSCHNMFTPYGVISLTAEMKRFIGKFDYSTPEERMEFPEEEFEVSIPDNVIEKINIDEVQEVLKTVPHLELVNS